MDSNLLLAKKQYNGKVIITGEHTILYGGEALVTPINCGVIITVTDGEGIIYTGSGKDSIINLRRENSLFNATLEFLEKEFKVKTSCVDIIVETNLPIGGFGSSSALVTSLIESILEFNGIFLTDEELITSVISIESSLGSKVSGIDQITIIKNRPLVFKQLDSGLVYHDANLLYLCENRVLIINTGRPLSSTSQVVTRVNERFNSSHSYRRLIENTIELNNELIKKLTVESSQKIYELIDKISVNLISMGIVSVQTQGLLRQLQNLGLHVKISGAGTNQEGPSGAIVAFCSNEFDATKLNKLGLDYFEL